MNQHDIEELLQQYGEDQRQQQHAAEHVRGLARKQAHRRTALACIAVMAAIVGTMIHRWQQLPEPTGILVAEQQTTVIPQSNTMPPTVAPDATSSVTTTRRPLKAQLPATKPSNLSNHSDYSDPSDYSDYSDHSNPSTAEPATPIQSELPPFTPLDPFTPSYHPTQPPQATPKSSRLHLIASIGASTLSGISLGVNKNIGLNNITEPESMQNYTSITPTQNLSANLGVAYTVASNSRSHLDVGISLSGYAGQGDLHIHETGYTYANCVDGNSYWMSSYSLDDMAATIPSNTDLHYTYNTFSLYAGVPLTLNMHARGTDRMGWQLSLTPAHSLTTSRHIGNLATSTLNPWKLTVGIGIAFPESVVRHISLTANLLPTYTSHSLHEFGIEIGI